MCIKYIYVYLLKINVSEETSNASKVTGNDITTFERKRLVVLPQKMKGTVEKLHKN